MEELLTRWQMDLLLGSCLGLDPRAPAPPKYLASIIEISNFVLKNCVSGNKLQRGK